MTYAIIGLGFISKRHIDSIKETGGKLLMACDIDPKKKIEGIPFYEDYREMEKDKDWNKVECVVICTPNDLHTEISLWAAARYKTVLCEKPFAISSKNLQPFLNDKNVYVVMQLRHHPVMGMIRMATEGDYESAELYVKVKRDASYWKGWKGEDSRSGGILFNLGVHYFDALLQLFGTDWRILEKEIGERDAWGLIEFTGVKNPVKFRVAISDDDVGQDRFLKVNGTEYRFSNQDNLSFEDLHKHVYEDLQKREGVRPRDILALTRFIEELKS